MTKTSVIYSFLFLVLQSSKNDFEMEFKILTLYIIYLSFEKLNFL